MPIYLPVIRGCFRENSRIVYRNRDRRTPKAKSVTLWSCKENIC